VWAAVAALVAACGAGDNRGAAPASEAPTGNDTPGEGGTPSGGGTPSIEPPPPARCGGSASLWIAGAHTGLVSSFRIGVRAAGAPGTAFDLAAGDRFRVGDVPLPASGPVTATIAIESARVAGGSFSGDVEVCAGPLAFTFHAGDVDAERCHVVIRLDLTRSLVRDPSTGALLLVPQATLRF
jgi:hypothetical protein